MAAERKQEAKPGKVPNPLNTGTFHTFTNCGVSAGEPDRTAVAGDPAGTEVDLVLLMTAWPLPSLTGYARG